MFYKVKEEGRTKTRCVYNILGMNKDGKKEVLGMYVSDPKQHKAYSQQGSKNIHE